MSAVKRTASAAGQIVWEDNPELVATLHRLRGDNLGYAEIAARTGLSEKAVAAKLRRDLPGGKWHGPVGGLSDPEIFARAKALAAEGLSCGAIAAALGVSRNAVIGKFHREHIATARSRFAPPRPASAKAEPRPPRRPVRPASAKAEPRKPRALVRPPVVLGAPAPIGPLCDFPPAGACRFIADDPIGDAWRCCGADTNPGSSWCAAHRAVVFARAGQGAAP